MLCRFSGKAPCPDQNLSEIQNLDFNVKTKRIFPNIALKNEKLKETNQQATKLIQDLMVASSRVIKRENKKLIPESNITKILVKPLFKLRQ